MCVRMCVYMCVRVRERERGREREGEAHDTSSTQLIYCSMCVCARVFVCVGVCVREMYICVYNVLTEIFMHSQLFRRVVSKALLFLSRMIYVRWVW